MRLLLRGLRSVSGLTWTTLVLLVLALVVHTWILFSALAVVLILALIQWLYFHYYLVRAGLEEVDEMTGWEFERWLHRFLEGVGYDVQATPYRGDFGADFILTWNGMRIAVQAKRSSRQVGVRAVQEVVAAAGYYGCERAMVITNSSFTEQAILLAHANRVWMRDRDDLALKIGSVRISGTALTPAATAD